MEWTTEAAGLPRPRVLSDGLTHLSQGQRAADRFQLYCLTLLNENNTFQ